MKRLNARGFTIIELLIATVIFSLILLVVTGSIIQFSKIYYKGVATSKTQEVARTIAEDMARSAQFSSAPVLSGPGCYLFGSQQYVYTEDEVKNLGNHIFQVGSGSSCGFAPSNPAELMGDNMQLLDIDVQENPSTNAVTITVAVGYGSDVKSDNTCPAVNLGGQFCAVSTITTTVTKRL